MKRYQIIERYFNESRVVVTIYNLKKANEIAIDLQKAYLRNGLSHCFMVREIKEND